MRGYPAVAPRLDLRAANAATDCPKNAAGKADPSRPAPENRHCLHGPAR
jgi:hypothetical protein